MNNAVHGCRIDGSGFVEILSCTEEEVCQDSRCIPLEDSQTSRPNPGQSGNILVVSEGGETADDGEETVIVTPPPYVYPGTLLRMQFQVANSVDGGFFDIGFCGGVPAVNVFHALCSQAVFMRIQDKGLTLEATLYNASNQEGIPEEIPGSNLLLDENEAYTLSFTVPPTMETQPATVTVSMYGVSPGSNIQATTVVQPEDLIAFGVWNYDESNGPEAALSGVLIQGTFTHSDLVEYGLLDFLELATPVEFNFSTESGGIVSDFYFSGETRNSLLLSMEYLRN